MKKIIPILFISILISNCVFAQNNNNNNNQKQTNVSRTKGETSLSDLAISKTKVKTKVNSVKTNRPAARRRRG